MKVQKRLNRKVGDKEYAKWEVDIPPAIIKAAGWKDGIDLDVEVKDQKVTLRPKKTN